jgi:hypothetical protein
MQPNRLGLGLRPPLPSYGQGPSMSALAQQQQQMHFVQPQAHKQTNLFVGSISGGITDAFLNQLLSVRIHVGFFFDKKGSLFSIGLWTHKIFQATDYSCEQTSRVWFCGV